MANLTTDAVKAKMKELYASGDEAYTELYNAIRTLDLLGLMPDGLYEAVHDYDEELYESYDDLVEGYASNCPCDTFGMCPGASCACYFECQGQGGLK